MSSSNVKPSTYFDSVKKNKEDPKLFIIPQYQNIKTLLQKINFQIAPNKFL